MKKIIIVAFLAVCSLVLSFASNAQQLSKSDLPVFVTEMNKTLPQPIDKEMTFYKVQLLNGGNQMDFVIHMNSTELSSDEFIEVCKSMTKQELRNSFGTEFKEMVTMLPVPVSVNFVFKDGKSHRVLY